eukprot:SAG11_NODE_27922_length_326_cov_0.833333_1_plen_41_part_00
MSHPTLAMFRFPRFDLDDIVLAEVIALYSVKKCADENGTM